MNSIAFIGNYAPRCCGIATFTHDLRTSLSCAQPKLRSDVVMVSDNPDGYDYPREVRLVLSEKNREDYRRVALSINRLGIDCVSLQHEFGIYGGPDGAWIIDLLQALRVPVVTTCHTLLKDPSPGQRHVLRQIGRESAHMVVMAEKGRSFLNEVFEVPDDKISVIPHGIPDATLNPPSREALRERLGWSGHSVLLTFGLLSPNKGLEHAIRALPEIVRHRPETIYVVVGKTHPNLVREQGEAYRESLLSLAAELGVSDHIRLINRFVGQDELVGLLHAADIYVTPYLNEAQITSGTLSYAYGIGKPIISTPYWHAAELLGDGAGVLIPFNDSGALATAATSLLQDEPWRSRLSARARERGQSMTWSNVGRSYFNVFARASAASTTQPSWRTGVLLERATTAASAAKGPKVPIRLSHLERLSGCHGIYQHARLSDPDPRHGFCLDDNARAFILINSLRQFGGTTTPAMERLATRCAASLFHGFNPGPGRFRNFMDADGAWLEEVGSEDSHGRVLWAIGHSVSVSPPSEMRQALAKLFLQGCAAVSDFTSPRAWAFTLLGIRGFRDVWPQTPMPRFLQQELATRLLNLYRRCATPRWMWCEDVVTYDNGKIPQALLATYNQTAQSGLLSIALSSLEFLLKSQLTDVGHFRPIGCHGFWKQGQAPAQYDQQPLEAQSMIAACLEAKRTTGQENWLDMARRIHRWFHGNNDLGLPVAEAITGACNDGLQKGGLNYNQGAESTLAYLQSTVDLDEEMRRTRDRHDAQTVDPGSSRGTLDAGPVIFAA